MRIERTSLGDQVTALFKDSDYLVMISYKGLTVAKFNDLRTRLSKVGAGCHVLKNTLIRLGLRNVGVSLPDGFAYSGDTAVVYGKKDPVEAAKILRDFAKENQQVGFKGAMLDGQIMSAADAATLADMPSKEVVYSTIVGAIEGPANALVQSLIAARGRVVYVLDNFAKKLETAP